MIRSFIFGLLLFGGAVHSLAQPAPIYINDTATSVTNVDVDATIFVNRGYFVTGFGADVPWESFNTRVYTNSGIMNGTPGFRFDFVGYDGFTNPADLFLNTRAGNIVAIDAGNAGVVFSTGGGVISGGVLGLGANSQIDIWANSITNQGLISAGAGGIIKMTGQSVDLSGSGVIIESLADSGTTSGFFTGFGFGGAILTGGAFNGFFPEVGIYDLAWGISNDTNMFLPSIIQSVSPVNVISPPFQVTNLLTGFRGTGGSFNLGCIAQLNLQNAVSFVRTDSSSSTNFTVQVVIVKVTDTNITPTVNFLNTAPQYLPAVVELDSPATNLFTRQQTTNSLFLIDELPTVSPTNYTLLQNLGGQVGGLPTFRPVNFTLSRLSPFGFNGFTAIPTNDVLSSGLLYNGSYSNNIVSNIYAGYSAQVDSSAARLPALPGVSYKDRPGRVEIQAGDLNLNRARIRGEGLVSISASNFVGSPKALVDAPHFDYSLASPVKDLMITNLAPETVQRLEGPITAYSALWTNLTGSITQVGTNLPVTNVITIQFHLLLVDASGLGTIQPVVVHNLSLRSTTPTSAIDLQDSFFVGDNLHLEATNVTVHGRLVLDAGVALDATSMIGIKNFTNYGTIALPSLANFGGNTSGGLTDTNGRLSNFINQGTIQSLATLIRSDYFENDGTIISTNNSRFIATNDFCLLTVQQFTNASSSIGSIEVDARIAKFNGGSLGTAGDVRFLGGTAKFNNQAVSAGGGLLFGLTNVLTDTGPDAGNVWRTENGFLMDDAPVNYGNLFGTRLISHAPEFAIVQNSWSAKDFGTNIAGFTNNLAIGQLVLEGDFASEFAFTGIGSGKALYIDRLEFDGDIATNLATLSDSLAINNIEIYYADIAVGGTGISTGGRPRVKRPKESDSGPNDSDITAESVDQQAVTGIPHLHWVRDFAGPNSSVDVVIIKDGQAVSVSVNRALRYSTTIDSDNDGIPNFFDEFPFNAAVTQISNITVTGATGQVNVTFTTRGIGTYRIEATDLLSPANWQLVSIYQNTDTQATNHTVTDANSNNQRSRFYRVTFTP